MYKVFLANGPNRLHNVLVLPAARCRVALGRLLPCQAARAEQGEDEEGKEGDGGSALWLW